MYIGKVCTLIAITAALSSAATAPDVSEALEQGRRLQSQGRFSEAEQQLEAALRRAGEIPDQTENQVAALANLASVDIDLDLPNKALSTYQRAVSILLKSDRAGDPRLTELYGQMAELYLEDGQTSTAEKILRNLLGRGGGRPTERNDAGALALDVMACVYAHEKKLDRA
jgi:tetratricopeptide (TPR) repeat protein